MASRDPVLLQGLNITCMTGGRGQIVLGDGQGRLHFLSLEGGAVKISMTPAYSSQVSLMTQLKQNNYVITVGVRVGVGMWLGVRVRVGVG